MVKREEIARRVGSLMGEKERIRNIGIVAHIDHGKTTLTDTLLAGAGMISEELAGKQLFMDYDEQEQARGITINAANVSILHEFKGESLLINIIDTPGHVDFGGDVTRAMRAVDGAIVVVDAVEGIMPQTETVFRQALRERVKPVLFINKVDRLINELKVDAEQMQQRFTKIIKGCNDLIKKYSPEEFVDMWRIRVDDGSVAFGSAYYHWAISMPAMKKRGITFKEIYDLCSKYEHKELAKKSPVHEAVLDMVVEHLPNPIHAQRYRIPAIWKGDLDSEVGRAMLNCDENGPLSLMITKIIIDPHAGEVSVGRVFSGKVFRGQEVYIAGTPYKDRVQRSGIYMGPERFNVESLPAGNIAAVIGLDRALAGSTVSDRDMVAFERLSHISEPVVTMAVEAKQMKDLPRLVEVLRDVSKEDPSIQVEINQETGEHLISGMGELHLEVVVYRIEHDKKVDITTSEPIVVYRETATSQGRVIEGKSPNRHNRFYLRAEPLDEEVAKAMAEGTIGQGDLKDKKALARKLQDLGMTKEEARNVVAMRGYNLLLDMTKGIQYLNETMELVIEGFYDVMGKGPLSEEDCRNVKVSLVDAKLHEDAIHRGPAQVIPAVRNSIYGSILTSDPGLLEPKQRLTINAPLGYLGSVSREVQQRRGVIEDMNQEGDAMTVVAKVPVAEMFGFSSAIRSDTEGRALWSTELVGFELLPKELEGEVIRGIRSRKGLKPEPPKLDHYLTQ
jgi:elongation factor 2